jgi:hypothetical protein
LAFDLPEYGYRLIAVRNALLVTVRAENFGATLMEHMLLETLIHSLLIQMTRSDGLLSRSQQVTGDAEVVRLAIGHPGGQGVLFLCSAAAGSVQRGVAGGQDGGRRSARDESIGRSRGAVIQSSCSPSASGRCRQAGARVGSPPGWAVRIE